MTSAPIHYRIVAHDPPAHLFRIDCTVADPDPAGQAFTLPTWIPGSYLIREFARHVVTIAATGPDGEVALQKVAKDRWQAAPCSGPLTVRMEVYAHDLSVRTAYLDTTRGFFNGSSVFLRPEGRAERTCLVDLVAPDGDACASWRIATALPRAGAAADGFGRYQAQDYDELIDHPVAMSAYASASFVAGGAVHEIAVSGRQRGDLERLAHDLARICQCHCDLFGGAPQSAAPFVRYVFLVTVVGEGYGGLEHRASTSLLCKRDELPRPGVTAIGPDYRNLLGLASHEYFHAWNVKRIKPAAFAPYDLSREAYTRQLWAFEGITSYYDDLTLVRSGVLPVDDYLELLGRTISAVLRTPGRTVQSVAESSFDAWIKFYRADEATPNYGVSYYAKGALIALALDLELRRRGRSLDEVMRGLWQRYGSGQGMPEGAIQTLVEELVPRALDGFFARYVDGTEDPPLAELLAVVGIAFHLRAATGSSDRGGLAGKTAGASRAWLGMKLAPHETRLQYVFRGSPGERAGLAAGDVLVAMDGLRITPEQMEVAMEQRAIGERVLLHAFRRDELMTFEVTLAAAPLDTCWLTPLPDAPAATLERRSAWLTGRPPPADAGPQSLTAGLSV